jgi:hypothetical protein
MTWAGTSQALLLSPWLIGTKEFSGLGVSLPGHVTLGRFPLRSRVYMCIVNVGRFVVLVTPLRGATLALQGPGMDPVTLNSNFSPYASISSPVKWVCSRSLPGPWT